MNPLLRTWKHTQLYLQRCKSSLSRSSTKRLFSTNSHSEVSFIEKYPVRTMAAVSLVAVFGYYQYSIYKLKQVMEEDVKELVPQLSSFFQYYGSQYKQAALETFIESVEQEEHWNALKQVMAPGDDAPTPKDWKWILLEHLQKPKDADPKHAEDTFKMVVAYYWHAKMKQFEEEGNSSALKVKNTFTETYLRKMSFQFFIPIIAVSEKESQLIVMKVEMVHQSPKKFWRQPMKNNVFYVSKISICNPKEFWKLNDQQTMEWNLTKAKPWKANRKELILEEATAPGNLKIESSWKEKHIEVYKSAQLF